MLRVPLSNNKSKSNTSGYHDSMGNGNRTKLNNDIHHSQSNDIGTILYL